MRIVKVFETALRHSGMTQRELAEISGFPEQSIGQKINTRKTIKASEYLFLLKCMGIDMYIYEKGNGDFVASNADGEAHMVDLFNAMIAKRGVGFKEAAKNLGYTEQNFSDKLTVRESIRMWEMFDIIEFFSMDAVFRDHKTGEILMANNENNERVIGMADRTVYDTSKAQLLSTSLYADGKRKYGRDGKAQDLYLSEKDKYFFVEYSDDEKPKVRSVTCHVADAFIEKFGRTEQEAGTPA